MKTSIGTKVKFFYNPTGEKDTGREKTGQIIARQVDNVAGKKSTLLTVQFDDTPADTEYPEAYQCYLDKKQIICNV